MEYVTIVNRTSKDLKGTWDGREYTIKPGKSEFPRMKAEKFKAQNPVMGSLDPRTGYRDFKIGIVENKDPIEPLPEDLKEGVEQWDRSKLTGAKPSEVVPGDNGLYSLGRTAGSGSVASSGGFVSNSGTDKG